MVSPVREQTRVFFEHCAGRRTMRGIHRVVARPCAGVWATGSEISAFLSTVANTVASAVADAAADAAAGAERRAPRRGRHTDLGDAGSP